MRICTLSSPPRPVSLIKGAACLAGGPSCLRREPRWAPQERTLPVRRPDRWSARPSRARPAFRSSPSPSTMASGTGSRSIPRALSRPSSPTGVVLPLDLRAFGGSARPDIEVLKDGLGEGIPVTYVPARNTIFLSLALGLAEGAGPATSASESTRSIIRAIPTSRIYRRVPAACEPRDQGGSRGRAVPDPRAAARHDQGRHRRSAAARTRSGAQPQLLRPASRRPPLRPMRRLPPPREGLRGGRESRTPRLTHDLRRQGDLPDSSRARVCSPGIAPSSCASPMQFVVRPRTGPGDRAMQFLDTDFVGTDGRAGQIESADLLADHVASLWGDGGDERLVVVTGGEPMLQLDLALIEALHRARLPESRWRATAPCRRTSGSTGSASAPRPVPRSSSAQAMS